MSRCYFIARHLIWKPFVRFNRYTATRDANTLSACAAILTNVKSVNDSRKLYKMITHDVSRGRQSVFFFHFCVAYNIPSGWASTTAVCMSCTHSRPASRLTISHRETEKSRGVRVAQHQFECRYGR